MRHSEQILSELHQNVFHEDVWNFIHLKGDGSDRRIHRVVGPYNSSIGITGENIAENRAFIGFTQAFFKANLPVPRILAVSDDEKHYLVTDLGDVTLHRWQSRLRSSPTDFPKEVEALYREVLRQLVYFQIDHADKIDYSLCYQSHTFHEQAMRFDVDYFCRMFIEPLYRGSFDGRAFDKDIQLLVTDLLDTRMDFFLYRDFQSRNVMILGGMPFFIDYQSGRRGALQYDVASLLFDAKASIPHEARLRLLGVYMDEVAKRIEIDRDDFTRKFYSYAIIRVMQALGAFGNLGHRQKKPGFLSSIPPSMDNLALLATHAPILEQGSYIKDLFVQLSEDHHLRTLSEDEKQQPITVDIHSFGYLRSGIPVDRFGNGGGFVFDCRLLPNPGLKPGFTAYTGLDPIVQKELESSPLFHRFFDSVVKVVTEAIDSYKEMNYTNLQVSFGCTGGQHRSVYCAEKLAELLREKGIIVTVTHAEKDQYW